MPFQFTRPHDVASRRRDDQQPNPKSRASAQPPDASPYDSTSATSISDSDAPRNDSFLLTSNQLTRDYVSSNISHPSKTLHTATARSEFVHAVFGDVSLASHAENDVPFLRQLESRANVLIHQSLAHLKKAPSLVDVDALIAVFALVAARWPILVDTMEARAVILAIVDTMRTFSHVPPIVARCLTALRVFAVTDSARKRIMVDGGIDLTLDLMARFRKSNRVQLRATAVVANVAFGCTHRKRRIARQGAVRHILDAVRTFPADPSIHLRAALAIRNLTHEAQVNQYIAGNEGAVEVIASSLLRFRSSSTAAQVRFHCIMALESLCRQDERNRQRVIDVDALGRGFCNSLSADSVVVSKPSEDYEEELMNEDGDIIVDEEENLLPHVTANFRHGGALFPGRDAKLLDTSTSLSSSGCSERIRAPASPLLTDEGQDFANASEAKPSLIRAIVHSIRRDPDDALLVETAISLLTLVAMHRSEVQLRVGDVRGVQVAIAAMKRHSKHAGIVAKVCALVRALCFEDSNRRQVSSGLVVVIAAARDHSRDSETAREIVSALSNAVFEHEKNRAWVVEKGGVSAVVNVMAEGGRKDVMVLEAGICALRNFVEASESGSLSAAGEGAIRCAVNAMDRTKDAVSVGQRFVQEQCVLFLCDLARMARGTRDEMNELEAADWVENALAKLPEGEFKEVHASGDVLLIALEQAAGQGGRVRFKDATANGHGAPPSPTAIMGSRGFSRSLFGAFSLGKRSLHRNAVQGKAVVTFPGRASGTAVGGEKGNARKSARLRRGLLYS